MDSLHRQQAERAVTASLRASTQDKALEELTARGCLFNQAQANGWVNSHALGQGAVHSGHQITAAQALAGSSGVLRSVYIAKIRGSMSAAASAEKRSGLASPESKICVKVKFKHVDRSLERSIFGQLFSRLIFLNSLPSWPSLLPFFPALQLRAEFDELLQQTALPSPARIGFMANEAYLPEGISAGPRALLVTILREPHARILSEYLHKRSEGTTTADFYTWLQEGTPGRLQAVDNGQVRRFCGSACWSRNETQPLGVAHLRQAVRNLLQFSLVWDVDSYPDGVTMLKAVLGWKNVRNF